MFRNLALKQKTIGGFGVLMLLMCGMAALSVVEIRVLSSVVSRTSEVHKLTELGTDAAEMIGIERAIILFSIFDDKAKIQLFKSQLDSKSRQFSSALDRIGVGLTTHSGRDGLASLRTAYEKWAGMHRDIVGFLDKQQVDVAQSKLADAAFLAAVEGMRSLANLTAEVEATALLKEARSTERMALVIYMGMALLGLTIGGLVMVSVRKAVQRLGRLTDALAGNSDEVAALSVGVHTSSETLARGSSEQAASIEETSTSSEEITAMTRQNVNDSRAAADVMTEVDQHIRAGNQTLDSMLVSMKEINLSSSRISKIIKVIDEIAFQTNILALNAAVEAARAGEAGLGFAVVADEVRNLAQRSAQAAKDTAGMIEESISNSADGNLKLEELTGVIHAITESASKVKTLVDHVSVGSQEQARGIEQISKAMCLMDRATQDTVMSAQEGASASDKLSAQARSLSEVVVELRDLVEGGRGR